jgi:hypothetical protein
MLHGRQGTPIWLVIALGRIVSEDYEATNSEAMAYAMEYFTVDTDEGSK